MTAPGTLWALSVASGRGAPVRARQSGFTLVELLVAITGGLFVTMVVFALARESSRFYQRESRVAEATLGNLIGFERLHHDIARAGFLSTPNIRSDPTFCGNVSQFNAFPLVQALASIQITASTDANVVTNSVLQSATPAITPQDILLTGAYNGIDRYHAGAVVNLGSQFAVRLDTTTGPLMRFGWATLTGTQQQSLVARLFPANRLLRLVSVDSGTFQLGVTAGTGTLNGSPTILLAPSPTLILSGQSATRCSASTNQLVNIVDFVRYGLRKVNGDTTNYAAYQQLFNSGQLPGETDRLELVREELGVDGAVLTREVVAEYAVDLRFAITHVTNPSTSPALVTLPFGAANVLTVAGPIGTSNPTAAPQSIRSVRARLSVRSREADRDANISTASGSIAPGVYRIGLGASGAAPFARVRTLQADTFISSQSEVMW